MSARKIIVEGRVQGVWFRDFTRRLATRLGVTGWVRNREDGRVELEACGDDEQLAELVRGLRVGPPAARVTAVREQPLEEHPDWHRFEIVY